MVTGGLGFIGSNLAHQLVDVGADVLVVDAARADCGGNMFNVEGIADRITVVIADLRERQTLDPFVRGCDVIFHLAGHVSHVDSMGDPETDLELNCRASLSLLEACRAGNPRVKVVFAGTRQIYGRPASLPVSERHEVRPTDISSANKAAAERYHLIYGRAFGLRSCSLRLSNVYGPRQLIRHGRQGFIGWFIRLAVEDREIAVYGDGSQLRDPLYVDDAVDAFLRAGASELTDGEVFNVGGLAPISHRELAALLIEIAGGGRVRYVEWPPEHKAIDIGSFYADWTKFARTVGWAPRVDLRTGLARTVAYYRKHLSHYLDPPSGPEQATA